MKREKFLRITSVIAMASIVVSMNSVTAFAEDNEPQEQQSNPIVANGETITVEDDVFVNNNETVAVGAVNNGEITVDGNVTFESTRAGFGAAVVCTSTSVSEVGGGTATINGDIKSNADGVNAYGDSSVTVNGNITAGAKSKAIDVSENSNVVLNGSITEGEKGVVAADYSAVTVKNDINATAIGVSAYDSLVTVDGNISGCDQGISMEEGTVKVGGNVTADTVGAVIHLGGKLVVNGNLYGEGCGLGLDMTSNPDGSQYTAVVGDTLEVKDGGYAIYVGLPSVRPVPEPDEDDDEELDDEDTDDEPEDPDTRTWSAPTLVVFKIKAQDEDHIVQAEQGSGPSLVDAEEAKNAIKSAINYIMKIDDGDKAIKSNSAKKVEGYKTMKNGSSVTISLKSDYYLQGNDAVKITRNSDGTYTVTLNSAFGGIRLWVIRKAIEEAIEESQHEIETPPASNIVVTNGSGALIAPVSNAVAPARTVSFKLSETTPSQMKEAIVNNIATTPAGGVLRIETDSVSCFDEAMLEAFEANGNIDIELIFMHNGQRMRIFIPRGTNIRTLLDEKGYCGYLRLAGILGAQTI